MGNVASVKSNEDPTHLEINEKLVQDFQYHIRLVDHSMAAFAKVTKSLREPFETAMKHENDGNDDYANGIEGGKEPSKASEFMIIADTTDETLPDQCFIIMDSLCRLLNFIIETGRKCSIDIPDDVLLFTKRYKRGTFADILEKDMQYHDAVIQSLQKKLKRGNELLKLTIQDTDNFKKRELLYQKEIIQLKDKIHDLETAVSNAKVEVENIRQERNESEIRNEELQIKVKELNLKIDDISEEQSNCETQNKNLQSEKEQYETIIKTLRHNKEDLCKKLNEKQTEIDLLKVDLSNEKQRAASLQSDIEKTNDNGENIKSLEKQLCKQLDEHYMEVRKEMIVHETKIKTIFAEEISKVNVKAEEMSRDMLVIKENFTRMNSDVRGALLTENKRLSTCLNQSFYEEVKYIKSIACMRENIKETEKGKTVGELEKQLNDTNSELQLKNKENNEKRLVIESLRAEIDKMSKESIQVKHKEASEEISKEETALLQNQSKEKDEKIDSLEKEIRHLTEENKRLTIRSDEMHIKLDSLISNLHIETRRTVYVLLVLNIGFDATGAEKELKNVLTHKLVTENIHLRFIDSKKTLVQKSDLPIFVLGLREVKQNRKENIAKISDQFKDIQMNEVTVLILFHKENKENRSVKKKEEGVNVCYEGKPFHNIFDIIYNKEGITDCDENFTNIDRICKFIKESGILSKREVESAV